MKIKQQKQLNLPQLIEWAWENGIKIKVFFSNKTGGSVYFDEESIVYVEHEADKDDTFTVTTEEEITEDTVFEFLILIEDFNPKFISPKRNKSINEVGVNTSCILEIHAYIDGEFKLIWTRDKGLVE